MPDPTPADHLAWAICAAVRPERDEDGEWPCRVPCLACRAGAAAVIRAAADQVMPEGANPVGDEHDDARHDQWMRIRYKFLAKAAELEVPHV